MSTPDKRPYIAGLPDIAGLDAAMSDALHRLHVLDSSCGGYAADAAIQTLSDHWGSQCAGVPFSSGVPPERTMANLDECVGDVIVVISELLTWVNSVCDEHDMPHLAEADQCLEILAPPPLPDFL